METIGFSRRGVEGWQLREPSIPPVSRRKRQLSALDLSCLVVDPTEEENRQREAMTDALRSVECDSPDRFGG